MPELMPLSPDAVPTALEKAQHYRLLNEPLLAESICMDVLDVDPDHQEALATLLLALTDQFETSLASATRQARDLLPRIGDEYHRVYFEGLIWERRAKAQHSAGGPGSGHLAYEGLHHAMECYRRAIELRPPGNDESILRWNTCVRVIKRFPEVKPAPEDSFQPMLE